MSLERSNTAALSGFNSDTPSEDAPRHSEQQTERETLASERLTQKFAIPSILDLVVDRSTLPWARLVVGFGLVLALLPFLTAFAESLLWPMLARGEWRLWLGIPVSIVYFLLTIDHLAYLRMDVVTPLRRLIQLDDVQYNQIFQDATRLRLHRELAALALGILLASAQFFSSVPLHYVTPYVTYWLWYFELILCYSLLTWMVYRVVINTRLIAVLHAQPMQVNIFNIEPFEPVGRSSLDFAMVFLGYVALGALFTVSRVAILSPVFWIAYTLVILIPVAFFFLGMRHTHRVLVHAKQQELDTVKQHIASAYWTLTRGKADGEDVTAVARESNAWFAYQQELKMTRTWPYNTEILNTLAISVMVPIGVGLAKVFGPLLLGPR